VPPSGGLEVTPLPEVASVPLFRLAWANWFVVLPDDVLATRSAADAAQVTCLALDRALVWLAEGDAAGRDHPRVRAVPVEQVRVVTRDAPSDGLGGWAVVIGDRTEDLRIPLREEDLAAWRLRLPHESA
jgi:hypothetical protein